MLLGFLWSTDTERFRKFQKSCRASDACRRDGVIGNAQLGEHRGLIPVDVLVGDFVGFEPDDGH